MTVQAVALRLGWSDFLSAPLVVDFLWSKFTAGVEPDSLAVAKPRGPGQVCKAFVILLYGVLPSAIHRATYLEAH